MWASRFERFARRKERQAREASIEGFVTAENRAESFPSSRLGNAWTEAWFDGPFYWTARGDARSTNLVFVRSHDGNTVADDPSQLGGGETDKHLIYEGLSRVHVDGVLAGARTAFGDADFFCSVWHPEIVRLRASLGKPRHPAQVVVTARSATALRAALQFNVPDAPAVLVTSDAGAAAIANWVRTRPWIDVVATGTNVDLGRAMVHLAADHGIRVVSVIGGRALAASLIDAGEIDDLYLTTSPISGGERNTPLYASDPITGSLVVRKEGRGNAAGVVFEHVSLRSRHPDVIVSR